MNIFVICPVRLGESMDAIEYVHKLEDEGHKVYYPARDTCQDTENNGLDICSTHREVIKAADEVHVAYHADSQGIHFDLGMAFAFRKKIVYAFAVKEFNEKYPPSVKKQFTYMLKEWEKQC
jgi:hypothetical protein